jgi:hypothetical protein
VKPEHAVHMKLPVFSLLRMAKPTSRITIGRTVVMGLSSRAN